MAVLWVILILASTGLQLAQGLPVNPTPRAYPHEASGSGFEAWSGGAVVPALAVVFTAIGVLFGCTWCYRHKDCKLFTASVSQLHDARRSQPPDSGFSETINNNISEDNNNGPISMREMQNIANNNAAVYITSDNEQRNRLSRESVVEFEPLPSDIRVVDPLERCADWFAGEDFPRDQLQYLREIGRGWFGRVVEGEVDDGGSTSTVAVKILNQNASLEDKARFLDEGRLYRDMNHENVLGFVAKCLQEDPWILLFELCPMDLQQYLIVNRPKMAILNENGVPLQLMCDVTSALAYIHSRGYLYGNLWSGNILIRGTDNVRAVLGQYSTSPPPSQCVPPETDRQPSVYTWSSEVWSLGWVVWEVCSWGAAPPATAPPAPDLPCPYRNHLYQVMQLCWNQQPEGRPSAAQVHALINHLHSTHSRASDPARDDGYSSSDFEERWQRLKPNTIPKVDEHVAIVHAPSASTSHLTVSEELDTAPTTRDSLSVDLDTAVSRSSSIMSDRDPLSIQIKSDSLTNLHGSLEDVRNIYLTHNETAALECHQGNVHLDDGRDRDQDRSDSSMDPWVKDIINGSQDDVSYYKDVSDVIKNLDNILNSEKTSSSESSHQASPSRDNLSLECKKDYPMQTSMVKSPGISNFQNIIDAGLDSKGTPDRGDEDEGDGDTIGTLSHSFERHSDTVSQRTLENLTPETPVKDSTPSITNLINEHNTCIINGNNSTETNSYSLNGNNVASNISVVPKLMELCAASMRSVSETNEQVILKQDCQPPLDNKHTNSLNENSEKNSEDFNIAFINNEIENATRDKHDVGSDQVTNEIDTIDTEFKYLYDSDQFLPEVNGTLDNEPEVLTAFTDDLSTKIHNEIVSLSKKPTNDAASLNNKDDNKYDIILPVSEITSNSSTNEVGEYLEQQFLEQTSAEQPETVQNSNSLNTPEYDVVVDAQKNHELSTCDEIQISRKINDLTKIIDESANLKISPETVTVDESTNLKISSEKVTIDKSSNLKISSEKEPTELRSDSTVYMDLINDTSSEILKDESLDSNVKNVIRSCLELSDSDALAQWSIVKNDSTVYLDLPSTVKETHDFLHSEKIFSSKNVAISNICTSTPKGSEASIESTLEADQETEVNHGTVTLTKLEQRYVPENASPFESPSKSHHTDTYDENSSVVLGPFENCTLDLFKGIKSSSDLSDLHREEILALSSNFSEMNLETPSPLRDSNFLNEVPDIVPDEFHFDDIATVSEAKPESATANTDETEDQSSTEKRVSPLTPPNSPGNFLATTTHQKYLVEIDINSSNSPNDSSRDAVDVNQIDLQITTKLAMAENENNLNLEYSGPLSEEGLTFNENISMGNNDAIPESYLAGNKGSADNLRDSLAIDEERMKELRNELELKLPLAQVAGIEPAVEGEWTELPPPPELVLTYGALSPIAEETRMQLCAYDNDDHWNASTHTDSSASYPEPCNMSDEVTDLPTITKDNHTYTVHKEVPSSKEMTMSADSLNASPLKKQEEIQSPIDDRTYNKNDDDLDANCERLSQVSPCLLSPTTDTSVPESDNVAGASTLSKTTIPTDAKCSKPSETQCLSKATSIDSWCSNDTLYNVEENFDDLAMDSDIPVDVGAIENDKSESDDTLTHNDDDKELSHCSTYIIHDSKSEVCETFTPDSITANDNYTYTKVKSEVAGATPSVITKSDLNESTKNTQTKDLAYGTLMSGLPTYSHCTTELASGIDDSWKFQQPELVRRSPIGDEDKFTPPKNIVNQKLCENENVSPQLNAEPRFRKMESVEITCLKDTSDINKCESLEGTSLNEENDNDGSPNIHFRNMAHSVTSTPITVVVEDTDNVESVSMKLPDTESDNSEYVVNSLPNFLTFFQSAEMKPQDISSTLSKEVSSEILLEGESKSISNNLTDKTPGYSDFENSATAKPQDSAQAEENSSQKNEEVSSFQQFESSVKSRPQDLSSVIDASSLLLKSERRSSEIAMGSITNSDYDSTSHSEKQTSETESLNHNSTNLSNLLESHTISNNRLLDVFITDLDMEEETEQPHSIIITESPLLASKVSPNRTFDSHAKSNRKEMNFSYDSHGGGYQPVKNIWINESFEPERLNGLIEIKSSIGENEPISEIQYSSISMYSERSGKESQPESVSELERSVHETTPTNVLDGKSPTTDGSIKCNGGNEMYATVNFLNETFEELLESNVDDNDSGNNEYRDDQTPSCEKSTDIVTDSESTRSNIHEEALLTNEHTDGSVRGVDKKSNGEDKKIVLETNNFLQNEKNFCQLDSYFPLLSDIRFTGPATEIMSTSFTRDSPTDPTSPECEQDSKPDPTAEILKEWDSDSDSHSTNSSSGEFIWKQRDSASQSQRGAGGGGTESGAASGSGDSGSGSEGDEVEFVPSSWDCRAAPAKSSLRSLEQPTDMKKRVVFKRQKYHCVYEYPREAPEGGDSPAALLPDYSTYSDWDPSSVEEAEFGYGQLFGGDPLDLFPLRSGIAFGADYDEDFFISSSARPFESLGVMSTTSQFFPGMHIKPTLERELSDEIGEDFPPPPSPLPPANPPTPTPALAPAPVPAPPPQTATAPLPQTATALALTPAPSFDFTTPDSGVEDITPGSTADEDFGARRLPEPEPCWRAADGAGPGEQAGPGSPAAEALGGLRHTRDRLKLDLPPSPHAASPRHSRVFNFALEKPRRPGAGEATPDDPAPPPATPRDTRDDVAPEPTFSTFGKSAPCKPAAAREAEIVLTDELREDALAEGTKREGPGAVAEPVKGEGTVLDSGDEDSGIESSSKATLERNKHSPDVS